MRLKSWNLTAGCCPVPQRPSHTGPSRAADKSGLLLGILASRVLVFMVYQATPHDPLLLAGVVLAMALLGLLAMWIPEEGALSINPIVVLREQ
jgi:hypothetical protein